MYGSLDYRNELNCAIYDAYYLNITGGGGRTAIQLINGTDLVTAGGGGGGSNCEISESCGGGGDKAFIFLIWLDFCFF